jgi:hypothetical protein
VFDVLQQEDRRTLGCDDAGKIEKESPLSAIKKAVFAAKALFFRDPCDREGLAGKPRSQNVVVRNGIWLQVSDIAGRSLAEPGTIRTLCMRIPFAREATFPTGSLKAKAHSSDPGK